MQQLGGLDASFLSLEESFGELMGATPRVGP
jgi:hypothetical protein